MRMRFGWLFVAAVLALFVAVSAALALDGEGFGDVPDVHPFKAEIAQLAQLEIVNGFPDGTFRPDDPLIRQQMAKILVLAMAKHTGDVDNEGDPTFSDVTPDMGTPYPFDYVEEAATAGYFIGGKGMFAPGANITRVQLALVLVRAGGAGLEDPPAGYDPGFTDMPDYAAPEVAKAKYNGILDGKTATIFDPYANATRGQVCKMVSRLLQIQPLQPTNLVDLHLNTKDITSVQCIACHGDRAQEVSLDPAIPSAHALHLNAAVLAFSGMQNGCGACHVSTDIQQGSGASIGKQVDPLLCLTCHGSFAKSKHGGTDWVATNPNGCTTCHSTGSALDPAPAHEATPYVSVTQGQGCPLCHGGLALYDSEETN